VSLVQRKGLLGLWAGVMDDVNDPADDEAGAAGDDTDMLHGLPELTSPDLSDPNGFGAAANRSLLLSVGNIVPIIGGGFEGEVPNGLVLCGGMRPGPPPVLSPPK